MRTQYSWAFLDPIKIWNVKRDNRTLTRSQPTYPERQETIGGSQFGDRAQGKWKGRDRGWYWHTHRTAKSTLRNNADNYTQQQTETANVRAVRQVAGVVWRCFKQTQVIVQSIAGCRQEGVHEHWTNCQAVSRTGEGWMTSETSTSYDNDSHFWSLLRTYEQDQRSRSWLLLVTVHDFLSFLKGILLVAVGHPHEWQSIDQQY